MKQKLLICFVFALVLSGCGKAPTTQPTSNLINSDQFSAVFSLKELIAKDEGLKCTIDETDNVKKPGVVYYIDGKSQKMRTDIKLDIGESGVSKIVNSSMIMDNQNIYSWSSEQPGVGLKSGQINKNLNIEAKMNFDCEKWNINNSIFNLPTDINFSEATKSAQQVIPGTSDMCKVCVYLQKSKADCQKTYCK